MTEETKYILNAINSLADARAYVDHLEQILSAKPLIADELPVLKSMISRAYDRCVFLYGATR